MFAERKEEAERFLGRWAWVGHTVGPTVQPEGSGKGVGKRNRKVRGRVPKTNFSLAV